MSGLWFAAIPISPSNRGSAMKSALASRAVCSGVTTVQVIGSAMLSAAFRQPLGLLFGLLDGADIHEGVFRQVVPFAVADFLEAANGVVNFGEFAGFAGEDLRYIEWL